jgi:hypothetical protein
MSGSITAAWVGAVPSRPLQPEGQREGKPWVIARVITSSN